MSAAPIAKLAPWCKLGQTVAFLGSSGVGKSTLLNALFMVGVADTAAIQRALGRGEIDSARLARWNKLAAEGRFNSPAMAERKSADKLRHKMINSIQQKPERKTMIRKYKTEDTEALITIWDHAEPLAHPFLSADVRGQVREDMRNIYLPNAETWVLENGGAPVGFIAMIDKEIGGLFLDPSQQGKGMGRQMVDHVVSLKGPLTVEVFKDNKIGLLFYKHYGFEVVGEGAFDASGDETFKMAMPTS
ncbi:GNAT family N-acetyltransferase [Falsihalocynthiibacter sp. CO-5D18]|uniref:GNAT family N-acetyltransferase n=1 Tax=Falsihalocynthiibacter sp. CO-5D18 TaxID=3240872 RepID=UPI00350FFB13